MSTNEPNAVPPSVESTDAVKEAIASKPYAASAYCWDAHHEKCQTQVTCNCICHSFRNALAEAERKLAEQNRINDVLAANNAVLMENAVYADQRITAAETRAKELEAELLDELTRRDEPPQEPHVCEGGIVRSYNTRTCLICNPRIVTTDGLQPCPFCGGEAELMTRSGGDFGRVQCGECGVFGPEANEDDPSGAREAQAWNRRPQVAALTRKLAAAQNAAEMLWVVLANVSGGDWTKQAEDWQGYAARRRDNYFDAIDAPAGEEMTCAQTCCQQCGGHYTRKKKDGIRRMLSEHGECEREKCWCSDLRPMLEYPTCPADAPPPEPANAQGSEACVLCGEHVDGNGYNCDCHEDDPLPTFAPSFPPPFTVEEAREQAAKWQGDADAYSKFSASRGVALHAQRYAATLRHYADLLERDDALEGVAEDVVKAWTDDRPVNSAILNLRSVLAQRAKEKR